MSQAPAIVKDDPQRACARGIGLRVFAAATPQGYVVMPGGLTRVAASREPRVVSMQRGGGSKDTWAMSSGPVDTLFSLLPASVGPADLVRSGPGLPSRVAENLYWFGRCAERCDDAARLMRLALSPALQDRDGSGLTPVLELVKAFGIELEDASDEALLRAATDESNPFGLAANLRQLSYVAFSLRECMSLDNWRTINRLVQDPAFGRASSLAETLGFLDRTITGLMTLSGFALDGMTRDTGWRFLSIGRRSERLTFLCLALLCACEHGRESDLSWILDLADSIVTYRARYMTQPEWLPVLDLLVLDGTNPRSVIYQASGIHDFLSRLENSHGPSGRELVTPWLEALCRLDPARDLRPRSGFLLDTIGGLRSAVFALNDRLTQRYFSHAERVARAVLAP